MRGKICSGGIRTRAATYTLTGSRATSASPVRAAGLFTDKKSSTNVFGVCQMFAKSANTPVSMSLGRSTSNWTCARAGSSVTGSP